MLCIKCFTVSLSIFLALCCSSSAIAATWHGFKDGKMIKLPAPAITGKNALESVILSRRSVRRYADKPVALYDMAQLLWAAQGITDHRGFRASPSAGALYPLEIYLVAGTLQDLDPGVYRYIPASHNLELIMKGDQRAALSSASLGQASIAQAPACLIIAAVYQRTAAKYGNRAVRYVHIEAGHAGQNILLQATSIGLGTVMIGAFDDRAVRKVLALPADHEPISAIPTGYPLSGFPNG